MAPDSKLSPAAQAVLDVTGRKPWYRNDDIAAALRAAADQVAPEDYSCYTGYLEHDFAMRARNDSVREAILAIAEELEATQ